MSENWEQDEARKQLAEVTQERDEHFSLLQAYRVDLAKVRQRLDEARKEIPRAPTETETVCGACGGHGWVERGY